MVHDNPFRRRRRTETAFLRTRCGACQVHVSRD